MLLPCYLVSGGQSFPSIAKIKDVCFCTSAHPYAFMLECLIKQRHNPTLISLLPSMPVFQDAFRVSVRCISCICSLHFVYLFVAFLFILWLNFSDSRYGLRL